VARRVRWEKRSSGLVTPALPVDPAALSTFNIINVLDPREIEDSSRPPNDGAEWRYRLQDRGLTEPISIGRSPASRNDSLAA